MTNPDETPQPHSSSQHAEPIDLPAGSSREQQEAEAFMLRALSERLGVDLQPERIPLPEGGWLTVDVDGMDVTDSYCPSCFAIVAPGQDYPTTS
jgi:hypothetical protein